MKPCFSSSRSTSLSNFFLADPPQKPQWTHRKIYILKLLKDINASASPSQYLSLSIPISSYFWLVLWCNLWSITKLRCSPEIPWQQPGQADGLLRGPGGRHHNRSLRAAQGTSPVLQVVGGTQVTVALEGAPGRNHDSH